MKKLLALVALLGCCGPAAVLAQESPTPAYGAGPGNSLKLYPFAFVKSRFAISYERALQNSWALQLGLGVASNDQSNFYNAQNLFGYSADLQFRKYLEPGKQTLAGIYLAPHLGVKHLEMDYSYYNYPGNYTAGFNSTAVQGGLVMGYQLHILKVVVADVYAGGGYRHANPNHHLPENMNYYYYYESDRVREFTSSGVFPIMGLQIGVLF